MATQTAGSQGKATKGRSAAQQGARKAAAPASPETGTSTQDSVYAVVSVLYHALQGAETYQQYIKDAEASGDEDLTQFFQDCRAEEEARATRAKSLLLQCLEEEAAGDDEDEDEDEDEDDDEDDEEEDE